MAVTIVGQCSLCERAAVPLTEDKKYVKEIYIPFKCGDNGTMLKTEDGYCWHRIKIRYPTEAPLCCRCRREIINKAFNETKIEEEGK